MPDRSALKRFREMVEVISPIFINPTTSSLTISVSKRFFLFQLMNKLIRRIEEEPHLNFVALMKSYKVLGKFLDGTLGEFYRDRNKLYFKNFFYDEKLYRLIRKDLEELYVEHRHMRMTITKRGVVIYDNYKKNQFNALLLTIHGGTWVPEFVEKKLSMSKEERYREEDIETDKLYRDLVLRKGGIWIDSKQSRFAIDFNRHISRAIYADNSEKWINVMWKQPLTKKESDDIHASYREFYFTLARLIETHRFNIIFDGHSMRNKPGRPSLSFGTKYIPKFYMPIVLSMQNKLKRIGYKQVMLNKPYSGGYILEYLSNKFPNVFICSMEVNKRLYTNNNDPAQPSLRKVKMIARHIEQIFDLEVEHETS